MDAAATAARGMLALALVREVAERLAGAGVDVMPLKGALLLGLGVAGRETRYLGDVDVLVRGRDARRAEAVLESAGIRVLARASHATTLWSEPHGLHVDLHHRLFPPGYFRLAMDDVWARATRDGAEFGAPVHVMAPLDLYAHLVGHFVLGRHNGSDARHVGDFGAVAAHLALGAGDVAQHLTRAGLARAARYVLRETNVGAHRTFAREVLAALPPDRIGDGLALVTHATLARWPGGARPAAVVARLYRL